MSEAVVETVPSVEQLYLDYCPAIHRYLLRILGPEAAEDAVQETFLHAHKALAKMENTLKVRPWLYRIATNVAYDYLRRKKHALSVSLDAWEEAWEAEFPASTANSDPADLVSERALVRQALDQLPPGYRRALLLNACCGYNGKQIAAAVGIEPGGGKMYLTRARQKFRVLYKQLQHTERDVLSQ